jgi:hypothetical protein
LRAIIVTAMALALSALLSVAGQVNARDVVVVANLGATQAAKEALSAVRAGTIRQIGKLVIDPLRDATGMQIVPASRVIGHDFRPGGNV